MTRCLPPYGHGMATPGMVTRRGRRKFTAASNTACSVMLGLDRPSWMIGIAGGGILDHQRRQNAGRHLAQLRLLDRHHLRDGRRYVRVRLKEDLDDRKAGQRFGFDVLDVVDRGREAALIDRRDALADFLRRQPAIGPNDADDRNIDFRKDIGRHLQQHERAWRGESAAPSPRTCMAGAAQLQQSTLAGQPLDRRCARSCGETHLDRLPCADRG